MESRSRARTTFATIHDALQVPRALRAACSPFVLRSTKHNVPFLANYSLGLPEDIV